MPWLEAFQSVKSLDEINFDCKIPTKTLLVQEIKRFRSLGNDLNLKLHITIYLNLSMESAYLNFRKNDDGTNIKIRQSPLSTEKL